MRKNNSLLIISAFILSFIDLSSAQAKYINIATGSITGVYYPAGGAICRFVNRGRKDHGIRCSVESTGGSVANLNALRQGLTDFAIVQSDWQYHAYRGTGFFSDQKPFKTLRSVLSLYTETFAMAVRDDSTVKDIDDVKGKRVNYGPPGSGMYATMSVLARAKGWKKSDFSLVTNLDPSSQIAALCDKKIDVMIYTSGNPNGILQEATQYGDPKCRVKILDIDKKTISKLIEENPFYVKAKIPGGMYRNNPNDISTFGVKATLVTTEDESADIVYQLTRAVFVDHENFKTLHPVFTTLEKKKSVRDGNSAPLHSGSVRYYKEVGLLR